MDNLRHKVAVEQFSRVEKEDNITNDIRKWRTLRTNERAISKQRTLTGISRRNSPKLLTADKLFSRSTHFSTPPSLPRARAPVAHSLLFRFYLLLHPLFFSRPSRHIPLRLAFTSLVPVSSLLSWSMFSYESHLFVCRSLTPTTSRWAPSQY